MHTTPTPAPTWTGQHNHKIIRANKKRKTPRSNPGHQTWKPPQFVKIPNFYQQAPPHEGMISKGGGCAAKSYSNTENTHMNLLYYYSCEYDVDHDGWSCPYKKYGRIPNIPRDESHEYYGASMNSQHKCLLN